MTVSGAQMLHFLRPSAPHPHLFVIFTTLTSGLCPGIAQANLIKAPKEQAFTTSVAWRSATPLCLLLEVTEVGAYARPLPSAQTDCDIATDFTALPHLDEHGVAAGG